MGERRKRGPGFASPLRRFYCVDPEEKGYKEKEKKKRKIRVGDVAAPHFFLSAPHHSLTENLWEKKGKEGGEKGKQWPANRCLSSFPTSATETRAREGRARRRKGNSFHSITALGVCQQGEEKGRGMIEREEKDSKAGCLSSSLSSLPFV